MIEEPRYKLLEEYDYWGVIDTTEEFVPEEDWREDLTGQTVVDIMNSQDRKIIELRTENEIIRDVIDKDVNQVVNTIIEIHSDIREERKYNDRVRFERNTLKKWYRHLQGGTPTFNARELAYLKMLREE